MKRVPKRIPKKYIDQFLSLPDKGSPESVPIKESNFSIDDLINHGKSFYSDARDDKGNYIGTAVALEEALEYGSVASLPQLIAGMAQADNDNYLWQNWFTAHSEEVIGTHKGVEYLVIVHGGGILTPSRIKQAIKEGLLNNYSAKLTQSEFDSLFNGEIPVYDSIDEVINPFGHYGIKMPLETASKTKSGRYEKEEFLNNPLVLARVGTKQYLEQYFDKVKISSDVGNYHWFKGADASTPQARLLFVNVSDIGLDCGNVLLSDGRFVGVARSTGRKGDSV